MYPTRHQKEKSGGRKGECAIGRQERHAEEAVGGRENEIGRKGNGLRERSGDKKKKGCVANARDGTHFPSILTRRQKEKAEQGREK